MNSGRGDAAAAPPIEFFPALAAFPEIRHGFICRVPGIDVAAERDVALARLRSSHATALRTVGCDGKRFVAAEQSHGRGIALVDHRTLGPVPFVDGLITADARVCLGIYVADCCAIFLVEPARRVIALLHSGRKGTELGIATAAVEKMQAEFGCDPEKIVAQLSPCIRPPHFETDFAARISEQLRGTGVRHVFDAGTCTASHLDRYYSYRAELGRTGRMLALLALAS